MKRTLMMACLLTASPLAAKDWQTDAAASHLRFEGTAQGEKFQGEFKRYAPSISLEPGKPESVRIEATIDTGSLDTQNKERDDALATPEFFAFDKFPKARFKTLACKTGADRNSYDCEAELTIRDKTRKLRFPFTFRQDGDRATLDAEVVLNRMDYDIGTGEWADAGTLAHEVKVTLSLKLK